MDLSDLELLSDVAARRASYRKSMADVGVGTVCTDATGPARADATRSVWVNATKPSLADEEGSAAARRYVYSDTPCADAAGPEYADATRPAYAEATRPERADATESAYATRQKGVYANERRRTETNPVHMNDTGYGGIYNMMDFYADRKDVTLHEHVYSTEDASRRIQPMANRDVPEELLIEFDGLYSTTNRRAPTDQRHRSQRDDCGPTWGRERVGPYYHDTPADHPRRDSPRRHRSPITGHGLHEKGGWQPPDTGTNHNSLKFSVGAKLGTYNGSTCLETFLAKFENCSEYLNWSARDRLFHLKASLEGPAGQLLWNAPKDITVNRLVELLRNRFGTNNQAERYRAELRARKRRPNELLQSLYHDIARLMSLAYPGQTGVMSEVVARDAFLEALDDPQLRIRILEREPKTLEDALHMACRLEALERGFRTDVPPERGSRTDTPLRRAADEVDKRRDRYVRSASDDKPMSSKDTELSKQLDDLRTSLAECQRQLAQRQEAERIPYQSYTNQVPLAPSYFPPGAGYQPSYQHEPTTGFSGTQQYQAPFGPTEGQHSVPQTRQSHKWKPRRLNPDTCRKCFQSGHWAKDCPQSKTTTQSNVQAMTKGDLRADVYLDVTVYGRRLSVLLDSGCETSVIGASLLPGIRLETSTQELYAANGTRIPIVGETDLEFSVGDVKIQTRIVVSSAISEMILGIDFLTQNRCRWDFGRGLIELGGKWVHLRGRPGRTTVRRIYAQQNVSIPPKNVTNVPVKVMWSSLRPMDNDAALDPKTFGPGVMTARTLLDGNVFESAVQVMNLTDRSYRVRKGTLFGQAEEVNVVCQPDEVTSADRHLEPVSQEFSPSMSRRTPKVGEQDEYQSLRPHFIHTVSSRNRPTTEATSPIYGSADEDISSTTEYSPGDPAEHVQCIIDSLPADLSTQQRSKAEELILDNTDLFSKSEFDIGRTCVSKHHIDTGTNRPFKQPLRRHPLAHLPIIDDHVDKMLKAGVVSPTVSEWASNVVLIRKPDQTWRFCVDMRQLNNLTLKDSYPLPRVDSCLESLGGAVYFSTLDLRQGYWQQELDEDSSQKTAFVTRRGIFKFNVLAYGLCNAPASFQRLMDMVLNGLTWQICLVYLDDVVVFSSTFEDHVSRLQQVFDRFRVARLKLKPSKCKLFQRQIRFLGHIVSAEGVSPDPEKVKAVRDWPVPRNLYEVRAFVALASYYRRHIKGFADLARPLHELTQKGRPFVWSEKQQLAFEQLKDRLTNAPVLSSPTDGGKYWLDTDMSNAALGAVLQQEQNGEIKVIAYASRVLSPAEKKYCVTRKELLAVIYGLKQFRHFLLINPFVLRVDHSALTALLRSPNPLGQSARWLDTIADYNFEIRYRSGALHRNADSLSRKPCTPDERFPCNQCEKSIPTASDCNRVTQQPDYAILSYIYRSELSEHESAWVAADIETLPNCISDRKAQLLKRLRNQQCHSSGEEDVITPAVISLNRSRTEEIALETVRASDDDDSWTDVSNESDQEAEGCARLRTLRDSNPVDLSLEVLRREQRLDPIMKVIIDSMEKSTEAPKWDEIAMENVEVQNLWSQWATLEMKDGVLYRKMMKPDNTVDYFQLMVPRSLRQTIIGQVHEMGHLGTAKTQDRLRQYAYWRGWKQDVAVFVRRCERCNRYRRTNQYKQGPLQPLPVCTIMQRLHVDLMGPLVKSRHYKYLMSAVCPFSKYLIAVPLPDKSAVNVAKALVKHVFFIYGAVEFCFTDRGKEFENEVLRNVCQILGIHKSCTTGYRPNSDGAVEKTQATISSIFAKTVKSHQKDWSDLVPYVTFAYNTAVHSVTKHTPFYLMFARHPITGIDWQLEHPSPAEVQDVDEFSEQMRKRMREAHEIVAEQLKCAFVRNKARYDARVKAIQFKAEDFVWFFSPRKKQGVSRKWQLMTSGPYKVVRRVNMVNYVIQKTPRSTPFICHVDRLRRFEGELPRCWNEAVTESLPSTSSELGLLQPFRAAKRVPELSVTMTTENKPPPVTSVENIPTQNVPRRDPTSDCTDVRRPVFADAGPARLRRSQRRHRLPRRYCETL